MKSVILVEDQVQDEEFFYPFYRLQEEENMQLDVAAPDDRIRKGKYGIPIRSTALIKNLFASAYDLVIIPGGWAPEKLRMLPEALDFLRDMNKQGKVIAAICHGPQVLISAGLCKGKKMTCYKGMKDDLINAGAEYVDADVVVDGNMITSPHYKNNPQFMKAIIQQLSPK